MILLIIIGVPTAIVLWQLARAYHPKREVVRCVTGTIGSGKTYYTTRKLKWDIFKCKLLHYTLGLVFKKRFPTPIVYSNVPLNLKGVEVLPITKEHLLLKEKFKENRTILVYLDEFGLIANQNDYDDYNIMPRNYTEQSKCLEVFMRFFRHIYGDNCADRCRIYLTDQSADDIVIGMRRRLGDIMELSHFRRWLKVTPFYKADVKILRMSADEITNVSDTGEENKLYIFGYLPYRWLQSKKSKIYDSHCYSGVVDGFSTTPDWNGLKTNYICDVRQTGVEKAYTKAKEKYLNEEVRKKYNKRMDDIRSSK